jgi:hypothetical protein
MAGSTLQLAPPADTFAGTVTLRNAVWKPDFLANPVKITQATLHLATGELRWDPVVFSYGPVKGTATLSLPAPCEAPQSCSPTFQLQFGALDAAVLQTAFLGAHKPGTLLSTLINRLRPTAAPAWPRMQGTVKAESLVLGPATLHNPEATVSTLANGAEITAFDAELLGGRIHGTGTLHAAVSAQDKPAYAFEAQLDKLSPPVLGQLLGLRCTGGDFNGSGKIELAGLTIWLRQPRAHSTSSGVTEPLPKSPALFHRRLHVSTAGPLTPKLPMAPSHSKTIRSNEARTPLQYRSPSHWPTRRK